MAGADVGVVVEGLAGLNKALKRADKETRLGIREVERAVAVPVQLDAQRLAVTEISGLRRTNMKTGGEWALMRIGVTQKLVYVAPKKRGNKRGSQKRPKFAPILMNKAMAPALERNRELIVRKMEHALDEMANHFSAGD